MLACQVGVLVDHLGFDPDPELHSELPHAVGQRAEALGPGHRIRRPVAEPGPIVATAAEPSVVEHVSLHAEPCGAHRECVEGREVVIEVHRLPHVECDGAIPLRGARDGSQVAVITVSGGIQPLPVAAVYPRETRRTRRGRVGPHPDTAVRRRGMTARRRCVRRSARGCRRCPRGQAIPAPSRRRTPACRSPPWLSHRARCALGATPVRARLPRRDAAGGSSRCPTCRRSRGSRTRGSGWAARASLLPGRVSPGRRSCCVRLPACAAGRLVRDRSPEGVRSPPSRPSPRTRPGSVRPALHSRARPAVRLARCCGR